MKIVWYILAAVALGGVAGYLGTIAEFYGAFEHFSPTKNVVEAPGTATGTGSVPDAQRPKVVVVNGDTHDFGELEGNAQGSHEFILKNEGGGVLEISSAGTSCAACTVSEIKKSKIPPGETAVVLVNWTINSPDPIYRKEAFLKTNDPVRPRMTLVVMGKVTSTLRADPSEVTFTRISRVEPTSVSVNIAVLKSQPCKIVSQELLALDTASFFDLKVEPASPTVFPGHLDKVKSAFTLTVTAKPGLPMGRFKQTIRVTTDLEGVNPLEIPVQGSVVGDVSIIGRAYDDEQALLSIGDVSSSEGYKQQLNVLVKRVKREDLEISIAETFPDDVLHATLGEPKEINDGKVLIFPLVVEIPARGRRVSLLGGPNKEDWARIILKTNHPDVKEIPIRVRFAVQN